MMSVSRLRVMVISVDLIKGLYYLYDSSRSLQFHWSSFSIILASVINLLVSHCPNSDNHLNILAPSAAFGHSVSCYFIMRSKLSGCSRRSDGRPSRPRFFHHSLGVVLVDNEMSHPLSRDSPDIRYPFSRRAAHSGHLQL